MNQFRKGFILPVIVAIVAILSIGAVVYFAPSKNTAEAPVVDVVDTSDWKTYTNEEYEFEFKYPNDWKIISHKAYRGILPSVGVIDPFKLQQYNTVTEGSFYLLDFAITECRLSDERCKSILDQLSTDEYLISDNVLVDGIQGLSFINAGFDSNYAIILKQDNKLYLLDFPFSESAERVTLIQKHILSTFKFTESKSVEPIACTMDAKMCPDGSYVGRSGPKCEFVCPTTNPVTYIETDANVKITPLEVIEDSRCPVDVTCVWAGTVKVRVEVLGEKVVLELGKEQSVNGVRITLKSVSPTKKSGQEISFNEYKFEFMAKTNI